jgi:hypothetical protein
MRKLSAAKPHNFWPICVLIVKKALVRKEGWTRTPGKWIVFISQRLGEGKVDLMSTFPAMMPARSILSTMKNNEYNMGIKPVLLQR